MDPYTPLRVIFAYVRLLIEFATRVHAGDHADEPFACSIRLDEQVPRWPATYVMRSLTQCLQSADWLGPATLADPTRAGALALVWQVAERSFAFLRGRPGLGALR